MLYTTEHTHLLESALEGQMLRFHMADALAKYGAFFTLAPQENSTVREDSVRQRPL